MKIKGSRLLTQILPLLLTIGLFSCASSEPKEDSTADYVSAEPDAQIDTEAVVNTTDDAESYPEPVADATAEAEMAIAEQTQSSANIEIKPGHPRQYTVKKGDTLWDISSLFLKDPWYWPEIWHKNPQVDNPHLIFPGDVLTFLYIDGQPRIVVNQTDVATTDTTPTTESGDEYSSEDVQITGGTGSAMKVVKLSPQIRRKPLDASITVIPSDAIRQFITRPRVVSKEELEAAPYILASEDNHLILAEGNRIYIRGELDKERVRYTVFRPGDKLTDPDTGEILGYEAIYSGEAHIIEYGDPARANLTFTEREVLIGDRLLPTDKSKVNTVYYPRVPDRDVSGRIISLFDAMSGIAKHQVAVINKGSRDGLDVGHILSTYTTGDTVADRFSRKSNQVKLPNERSGLMMIFKAFDNVSYGLMLESSRVIHNGDVVSTPH